MHDEKPGSSFAWWGGADRRLLYLIAFLSGFAALVYEILWTRQFALILGSTTAAISTVVSVFMGGLALGSLVLGRWIDRRRRLLGIYALLEGGIALSAFLVMVALPLFARFYLQIETATGGQGAAYALARILFVFAFLFVPTALMGGTFPVLLRALATDRRSLGASAGWLYAANTIGAVTGCAAAGTFLLGAVGLRHTNYVAIGLNLTVATLTEILDRLAAAEPAPAPAALEPSGQWTPATGTDGEPFPHRRLVVTAIGLSGAFALGYEIVWSRAMAIVLGHSIYAFTFVLSTYLAGLAIGGYIAALVIPKAKRPEALFGACLLAVAVLAGTTLAIIPALPFLDYTPGIAPFRFIAANLLCTAALLLPPTVLMGALLPLAIHLFTARLDKTGAAGGEIYASNTAGGIAGSLVTGFFLAPFLGSQPALMLLVLGNLLLALLVIRALGAGRTLQAMNCLLIFGAAAALFWSRGSPIFRRKCVERVAGIVGTPVQPFFYGEDETAAVGLSVEPSGLKRLFVNGTPMTHLGLETKWMAHLPLAAVPEARDMLVLCLGMGNTFLSASKYPVRATAVELSPKVVEAFHELHKESASPDSSHRILIGDARHALLTLPGSFDVISVDPPPPLHAAGTASFHTLEFYRLCKARLRPRGVVCQWIPFQHCTVDEFKMLLRTFRTVFDKTWVWVGSPQAGLAGSGAYLLGLGPEASMDLRPVLKRLPASVIGADMRELTNFPLRSLLPVPIMTTSEVDIFVRSAPIMDDDHPTIEFPLFQNVKKSEIMTWEYLKEFLIWIRYH